MNILIVDDERIACNNTTREVKEILPNDVIYSFTNPLEALEFANENDVDIAFLDIEMPEINGIELAKKLNIIRPKANIIFITAYDNFGIDAFDVHASGYLLKPIQKEAIINELKYLRYFKDINKNIHIYTFGLFDVIVNGEPVIFSRKKSKELLAYLVNCNGRGVTRKEIFAILFEDKSYNANNQNYLQKIIKSLLQTLEEYGISDILIRKKDYYAIDKTKVECDYFDYLNSNDKTISKLKGEYMKQYSWSEIFNLYF